MYKLNFDAVVFANTTALGIEVVIRNDKGQVMVALLSKGQVVADIEEAEVLACRKVLEFAKDAGFSKKTVEGDNIKAIHQIFTDQLVSPGKSL